MAADFEPKGRVARLYGAYREEDGTSERALFVIDQNGMIAWSYLSPVHPHAEHAAETAEFAAAHANFWELHDLLYENQENLEDENLRRKWQKESTAKLESAGSSYRLRTS